MKILGIIPARGGSKGIPRKNLKIINGKTLLQYAVDSGQDSNYINKLIVSTEDTEIREKSLELKCDVIKRPNELAADDTPSFAVIQHILKYLRTNILYSPDIIVLIQPTAPLRNSNHIDEAIEKLIKNDCDSVVSVSEVPSHYHHSWQMLIEGNDFLVTKNRDDLGKLTYQRQKLEKSFFRNGAVYVSKISTIKKYNNLYGAKCLPYIMPFELSINIDSTADLILASNIMIDK